MAAVWELTILSPLYFITVHVKSNCKQEYKIEYATINPQVLPQSNTYQDTEILYQESLALMRIIIGE